VFLSALATLGASSASTASAFGGTSSFGGSAVGMGMGMGMGGVRLLVTSAASTLAHALTLSLLVTPVRLLVLERVPESPGSFFPSGFSSSLCISSGCGLSVQRTIDDRLSPYGIEWQATSSHARCLCLY